MLHITTVQTRNTARTDWILPYNDWLTSSVADHDPCLIDTLFTDNNWHAPHWQWLTCSSLTIPLVDIVLIFHVEHSTAPTETKTAWLAALPAGELVPLLYHLFGGHISQGHGVVLLLLGVPGKKKYLLQWSSPVLKIKVYPEFWDIIKVFLQGKPQIPPSPTQVLALKVNHNSKLLACQFLLLSG